MSIETEILDKNLERANQNQKNRHYTIELIVIVNSPKDGCFPNYIDGSV